MHLKTFKVFLFSVARIEVIITNSWFSWKANLTGFGTNILYGLNVEALCWMFTSSLSTPFGAQNVSVFTVT